MRTRRELLSRTILASPLALAGCSIFSGGLNSGLAQVASDAAIIASGLAGALSNIGALNIGGLNADKIQTIGLAIAGLKSVATALANATNQSQAQPLVQQIETDLNAIVGALAGLPLPPQISVALQAAAILLPVIETAVNLAVSQIPGTPATAAILSPDQARLILKGAAARH
jgi:hypothetical protein